MSDDTPRYSGVSGRDDPFGSTHWSVVLAAGSAAPEALETLCQTYWLPVYGFVRARVSRDDADDLTQGFFADLLQRNAVSAADPSRGRFRAFLLTAVKNYLANQHARQTARKRGGERAIRSLDPYCAEQRLRLGASRSRTPEQEFERQWALALLERVMQRLESEHVGAGKGTQFRELRPFLAGRNEGTAQAIAAGQLGVTPEAVRAAVYRLRRRYRALLREEVARTVDGWDSIDDELRRLFRALGS